MDVPIKECAYSDLRLIRRAKTRIRRPRAGSEHCLDAALSLNQQRWRCPRSGHFFFRDLTARGKTSRRHRTVRRRPIFFLYSMAPRAWRATLPFTPDSSNASALAVCRGVFFAQPLGMIHRFDLRDVIKRTSIVPFLLRKGTAPYCLCAFAMHFRTRIWVQVGDPRHRRRP